MVPKLRLLCGCLFVLGAAGRVLCQETVEPAADRLRVAHFLEAERERLGFPGCSAAWLGPPRYQGAVAVGFTDAAGTVPLTPEHRLLSGSIGKTYVAALVLQLVAEGVLDLDQPVMELLEDLPWARRLPNAEDLTLRRLLRHQSGIREHVWHPDFHAAVKKDPDRTWSAAELLAFSLDGEPLFEAGEGWSYADTNYLVVGLVCEVATGRPVEDLLREHLFEPQGLKDTICSNRRDLPGLANGFASGLILHRGSTVSEGRYFVNPGFEWCGGGVASTPADLASWCHALFAGDVIPEALRAQHRDGVPADPRVAARYGLGVMLDDSPHGPRLGHEGIMVGYLSAMAWYPDHGIAVAIQFNTDSGRRLGRPLSAWSDLLLGTILGVEEEKTP